MAKEKDYDLLITALGMLAKNSKWSHNNEGLPSDPQIVDMMSQQFANQFQKEMDKFPVSMKCWNGTMDGYMMFIAIIYRMFHSYIGGLWEYSEEFLEALGLNKYQFEDMLIQAGKLALFYDGEGEKRKLFALPFEEEKRDIYNNPLKIKITAPNSTYFKNKHLLRGEFVIIKQNENGWNKLVENAPFLSMAYEAGCQLHDDIPRGQKHFVMLADPSFDNTAAITTDLLSDFSTDRRTFLALTPQADSKFIAGDPTSRKSLDISERFKNSLMSLDYIDRVETDFETYRNVLGEAFKYLGIDINANPKKKERQITGEIQIESEIPKKIRAEMFYERDYSLKELNKMNDGKTNFTITLNEDEPEPMEAPNPASDDSEGDED